MKRADKQENADVNEKLIAGRRLYATQRVFAAILASDKKSDFCASSLEKEHGIERAAVLILLDYRKVRAAESMLLDLAKPRHKRACTKILVVEKLIESIEKKTVININEKDFSAFLNGRLARLIANNPFLQTHLYWLTDPGQKDAPRAADEMALSASPDSLSTQSTPETDDDNVDCIRYADARCL